MSSIKLVTDVLAGNGSDETRKALANPESSVSIGLEALRATASVARSGKINWAKVGKGAELSELFDRLRRQPFSFIGTSEETDWDDNLTSRRA